MAAACPKAADFSSLRVVAQLAEHRSPKPGVGGSSPSGPAERSYGRAAGCTTSSTQVHEEKAVITDTDTSERSSSDARRSRGNIFSRIALFIRQTIVELRKVIWPTRKELIAYTTIVIVFVAVISAIIAGFDYVFTKGVLLIFG